MVERTSIGMDPGREGAAWALRPKAGLAALVLALACALAAPGNAWAQGAFESPQLGEQAQVLTTGTLHVVEQRTFAFSEPADVLRWDFTGLPEDSEVAVAAVRAAAVDEGGAVVGDWETLQPATFDTAWREAVRGSGGTAAELLAAPTGGQMALPEPGTWALDKWKRDLYVFFNQPAERMMFEIDWSATDAVAAFDDVAELYWDYVPARDDTVTRNVDVRVQLPVPEGAAVVPGETVLAWGHGAPGTVDVAADGTIAYRVPEVRAGQYAQGHILFPVRWLTNLSDEARTAFSGTRLDNAKAEEEAWTDTYSNQRVNAFAVDIAVAAVCAALLAAAIGLYATCGRERRDNLLMLTPNERRQLTGDAALMALFAVAAALVAAALVALFAFGAWLPAVLLLATGICMTVIANYMPRRTPKGIALAAALDQDRQRRPTPEDRS